MIKVQNLSKSYGETSVLEDLTFSVAEKTVCGLMGKNGAGKSTLLKILFGELDFSGTVLIRDQTPELFKRQNFPGLFFLSDSPHIYDYLTPEEYVQFVLESKGLNYAGKKTQCRELAKVLEIDHVLNSLSKDFSYGMKRKVALLSIILLDPTLLFLDEPTLGLDAPTVVIFKSILSAMAKKGTTVIVSSHEPDFLRSICEQLLILHDRKLAYRNEAAKTLQDDINDVYMKIIDADLDRKIQSIVLS